MRPHLLVLLAALACGEAAQAQPRTREQWLALASGGFAVLAGETPIGLLVEMNALLASGFLAAAEVETLTARLLDYFARERDTRGFVAGPGWMHSVAHTADAFKFLARGSQWTPVHSARLLEAMHDKLQATETVFVWGEQERLAAALHAVVRRLDAEPAAFEAWTIRLVDAHKALWAGGPNIDPVRFARVENARQTLRALAALLAMEAAPTPTGESARRTALAALARMR